MPQEKNPLPDGVYAATLTPLKDDLSVHHDALAAHCRWLLNNGCNGIVLLGSTGEANSFAVHERIQLLDALVESGVSAHHLLVGTGCCAVPDTVTLTKHAVQRKAGGVLVLPPFYYKHVSDEGLFAVFDQIIQQVGDSSLKIYLYHFPQTSGIPFSRGLIQRLIAVYPHTVVGIKDSGGDWNNIKTLCADFPHLRVFAGSEKFLLDILKIGGTGCISATTNITCKLAGEIYARWQSDDVSDLQKELTAMRKAFEPYPLLSALKRVMAEWTNQPIWLNLRPPHTILGENETASLLNALKAFPHIQKIFSEIQKKANTVQVL